jgi:hypothetical protein
MNAKRLFFLCCFAAVILSASLALADPHARGIASRHSIARSSPRVAPITRNSPTTFHRGNGNWNLGNRSLNRVNGNRNLANRNWSRGNGSWNRGSGNWRHRHGDSRIVFIGGFGYPWYYPYSYYNYYPYYPYGYDPYGYSYYNQGGYQGGGAYTDEGAYDDDATYNNGNAYRGGAAANSSTVAQIQRNLARGGYYKGPIDGEMGSRTYYAIRAYQRSHNLRVDGTINDQLLSRMGLR